MNAPVNDTTALAERCGFESIDGQDPPGMPGYFCTEDELIAFASAVRAATMAPSDEAIDAAAKWLCKNVANTAWDGLYEGRASDRGFQPWIYHNARRDDYRDAVREILKAAGSSPVNRACTCHPDDKPPRPCPKKYAYSECVAAHEEMVEAGADAIVDQILTEYLAPENVHEAKRRIARAVLVAADRLSSG